MKKRRRLLFLWIACCLGLMGPLIWQALSQPRIDAERFEQILPGMTLTQIEKLIGGPPGDYTDGQVSITHGGLEGSSVVYKDWVGDEIGIAVRLDGEGKIIEKQSFPTGVRRPFLEKLRRWLRL
jgi:hypothetical protein